MLAVEVAVGNLPLVFLVPLLPAADPGPHPHKLFAEFLVFEHDESFLFGAVGALLPELPLELVVAGVVLELDLGVPPLADAHDPLDDSAVVVLDLVLLEGLDVPVVLVVEGVGQVEGAGGGGGYVGLDLGLGAVDLLEVHILRKAVLVFFRPPGCHQ